MATVERSQRSSVVNGPPWRSATASAPIVTPWERSGATAAERTISPPIRSTEGVADALGHLDPLALDGEAHERRCRGPR